ncbi:hypothetical protein [Methanobrevibacter millerae]|uniref:Uncharacterized protein n=1 Tax=Methanobrevibacter millerae TaxID=230361 RepID=A0A1G5VJH1_9EURY|nr:hypothetical protein [Methanobrevibacter millerae]SDA45999.1 hypothetical protein SAMN02910315_00675 [Methanobrevibacter millerae]
MKNKYFPDEDIKINDLYFICYMIERVARHIKQKNKYVVNTIGRDGLYHLISCAEVLHCENPLKVESDWINDYELEKEIMILLLLIRNLLQSFQRPLIWAQYIVV